MHMNSALLNHSVYLFFTILISSLSVEAQIQKGNDIDGENTDDQAGYSISMPTVNTLAIGARFNNGTGSYAGHVRIYDWDETNWLQRGLDIDGEYANDMSGWAISMPDVNTVAIGAIYNADGGTDAGHVRVFTWDGTAWVQKGLDIDGEAPFNFSGASVSMPDANTIAIGAVLNSEIASDAGHVRIFKWDGATWIQKGTDLDAEAAFDYFGYSVSMPDSNTVAIGAPYNDDSGTDAGHIRVFKWNGINWIQKGIDINGEMPGDECGSSVSMPDSNTVAIGAPYNGGAYAGHVRVYSWDGAAWIQKGIDLDGENAGDESGTAVSMPDQNTLAIGAIKNSASAPESGQVRVYKWNGLAWVQKKADIDGEASYDNSGWSVSMPDSNTVAIGAPANEIILGTAGQVRVYTLCTNTSNTLSISACNSYTSPSGNYTWTTNGTYLDTIQNLGGCDSIITIHLTINTVDVSITSSGPTLTATTTGATYQWIDCNNSNLPLGGEINQSFTAVSNGSYAVVISEGGCTDTSACQNVTTIGVNKLITEEKFMVYPNPGAGIFTLSSRETCKFTVTSITGEFVVQENNPYTLHPINLSTYSNGTYWLTIVTNNSISTIQLVKH